MENSSKILFEDDIPKWYIALGDRWIGPLAAADVYQRVLQQEITWAHFIWTHGQATWTRICDTETFQAAVPRLPGSTVQNEVREAAKPVTKPAPRAAATPPPPRKEPDEKPWFLFYNDSQFGPFSEEEIRRFISAGKIHGRVHIWCDGMATWDRLERVAPFADPVKDAANARANPAAAKDSAPAKRAPIQDLKLEAQQQANRAKLLSQTASIAIDQRATPRRPLIARLLLSDDSSVNAAVCRDISVGGMQVLTDRLPGPVGTRIRMNVSPSSGPDEGKIEPFTAEGTVVRILEDGRGFSFRFTKLTAAARGAIELYISSSA